MSRRKSRSRDREVEKEESKQFTIHDLAALVNALNISGMLNNIKNSSTGAAVTAIEENDEADREKEELKKAIKLIVDGDRKKLIEAFLEIYNR